jgi:hypothetical protein
MILKLFMNIFSCRRFAAVRANALFVLALGCLVPDAARAFVFLDTSSEKPAEIPGQKSPPTDSAGHKSGAVQARDTGAVRNPASSVAPAAAPTPRADSARQAHLESPAATAHHGNILFLSADDMLVYAYIGVLKALETYRVRIDLVLAESKAVAVGGAWALGYDAGSMERLMVDRPLGSLLNPFPVRPGVTQRFTPYGPDPMQVQIPLDFENDQPPENGPVDSPGEFLQLSWMIARLTHDAPGGPVTDLQATPRPMAVQVTDLVSGQPLVLTDGELQPILKGSLLPKETVRARPRLRHYAAGSLLTGHSVLAAQPYTFDHMLVISPGPRLRPPPLEETEGSWNDSLSRRILAGATGREAAEALAGKLVRIELNPESWFDPRSREPREWMELGYTSALKSMDLILSSFGTLDSAAGTAAAAAPKGETTPLDLFSGNHLIAGGNELLPSILQESEDESHDTTGFIPIADLIRSGYYSDLDMEWVPGTGKDPAALVFEANEKTRLMVRAGGNLAFEQEEVTDRGPEAAAGVTWREPFYVPFQADVAAILGGHRPGVRIKAMVSPVVPFPIELGIARSHWEIDYPEPPTTVASLDPRPMRIRRDLTRFSLRFGPRPNLWVVLAGERHEMSVPSGIYSPDLGGFLSNDFVQQAFAAVGRPGPSGLHPNSLWVRGGYLSRVNVAGTVKYPFSMVESRLRLSLGDFRLLHQFYWSDQVFDDEPFYDVHQLGQVDAFTFQDEYFSLGLRAPIFQNVQGEYAPVNGRMGLSLKAGAYRFYGPKLADFRADTRYQRAYWEIQAAYATPLGPLRAGLGGLDGEKPIVFLRLGADLDLEETRPPN